MKINKQSSTYTIIYIIVLVVVVGAALAFTAMGLKSRQQENADADKMRQILASAHITPDKAQVVADFNRYVTEQYCVDAAGARVEGDAFAIDMAKMVKEPPERRTLPVFVCTTQQGPKYVLPVYGAGLWGPIWGYLAIDADGSTVYGAYFAHQGETPGLGAEIEKPPFCDQFEGKRLFADGRFHPIEVVKAGQKPADDSADYVDGVTGGTITSKGVGAMIDNCLTPYARFLAGVRGTEGGGAAR